MLLLELTRGEIVAVSRKRRQWSQTRLAQKAGLSRSYIRMIEAGEADNLSERVLFALADALDLNISQLLQRPH